MKNLSRWLLFTAACTLLGTPALAAAVEDAASPPETNTVIEEPFEFDMPDTIVIEEEEVPLSAMPMLSAEVDSGVSARALMTAGILMMGLSAVGIVWTRVNRVHNEG